MKYQLAQLLTQKVDTNYNIVNMSSIWGAGASDFGVAPYIAAKHGVIGLTEAAALEYAKDNIRVNAICPGWVFTEKKAKVMQKEDVDRVAMNYPLKRLGNMAEIAQAVLWLASPASSFVTGHSLTIDGGLSVNR